MLASHHAGDGEWPLMIRNDQRIAAQGDFLAIQQNQLFAFFSHTNPDAALDFIQIKRVQRLAQLEHHIVSDINNRVDTANIGTAQALHHPEWRRACQIDIVDHSPEVARTSLRRQHLDRAYIFMGDTGHADFHRTHFGTIDGTDFPSQTG